MPATPPALLGSYARPALRPGDVATCAIRGEVEVVRHSDAPIPWPVGRCLSRGRQRFLILCGDLVKAVKRESALAVARWWGVGSGTVWRWRQALGVGATTEGTTRLRSEVHAGHLEAAREAARPTLADPVR